MLSSGANVIIWDGMLSSGMKCYHLELMLSSGANVIIWDEMPSSGANVIICIYCYHLVLSCDVIIWDDNTPLFIFPENFTHSSFFSYRCYVRTRERNGHWDERKHVFVAEISTLLAQLYESIRGYRSDSMEENEDI